MHTAILADRSIISYRRAARIALAFACAVTALLWARAGTASAGTCSYDLSSHVVAATTSAGEFNDLDRVGDQIHLVNLTTGVNLACGVATVYNTDTVNVTGSAGNDHLGIDESAGRFEPGLT